MCAAQTRVMSDLAHIDLPSVTAYPRFMSRVLLAAGSKRLERDISCAYLASCIASSVTLTVTLERYQLLSVLILAAAP